MLKNLPFPSSSTQRAANSGSSLGCTYKLFSLGLAVAAVVAWAADADL